MIGRAANYLGFWRWILIAKWTINLESISLLISSIFAPYTTNWGAILYLDSQNNTCSVVIECNQAETCCRYVFMLHVCQTQNRTEIDGLFTRVKRPSSLVSTIPTLRKIWDYRTHERLTFLILNSELIVDLINKTINWQPQWFIIPIIWETIGISSRLISSFCHGVLISVE